MKFALFLGAAGTALAGCSDQGRSAPPVDTRVVCQTTHKSPFSADVRLKYIPYFNGLTGVGCGTDGGCCTGMYKNAKMCGKAGSIDCSQVAVALQAIIAQCTFAIDGKYLAGGAYWAGDLNSGTWVSL